MKILFYCYANALDNGREVAIKVQKREIANQVGWDLWAFK
jgi:aarF domain-containing kinase